MTDEDMVPRDVAQSWKAKAENLSLAYKAQAAEIERLRGALTVFGGEAAIEAKQLFIRMTATPKCSRKRKELAAHHYEASRKAAITRDALAGKAEQ